MSILNIAYHWGALVLPLGYGDEALFTSGNPYGASHVSEKGSQPGDVELEAARLQGVRLARFTAKLVAAST